MKQNKTMKYNKIFLLIFLFSIMNNTAQDINIQGGGTLMDWAHLKKYEQSNSDEIYSKRYPNLI